MLRMNLKLKRKAWLTEWLEFSDLLFTPDLVGRFWFLGLGALSFGAGYLPAQA